MMKNDNSKSRKQKTQKPNITPERESQPADQNQFKVFNQLMDRRIQEVTLQQQEIVNQMALLQESADQQQFPWSSSRNQTHKDELFIKHSAINKQVNCLKNSEAIQLEQQFTPSDVFNKKFHIQPEQLQQESKKSSKNEQPQQLQQQIKQNQPSSNQQEEINMIDPTPQQGEQTLKQLLPQYAMPSIPTVQRQLNKAKPLKKNIFAPEQQVDISSNGKLAVIQQQYANILAEQDEHYANLLAEQDELKTKISQSNKQLEEGRRIQEQIQQKQVQQSEQQEKSVKCNICESTFTKINDFFQHVAQAHKAPVEQQQQQQQRSQATQFKQELQQPTAKKNIDEYFKPVNNILNDNKA